MNANRILFNVRAPDAGRALYRVRQREGGYVLEAGSAHGISLKALFAVYATRNFAPIDAPLGTLIAGSVDAFETTLELLPGALQFVLPDYVGFALQTRPGVEEALRLYVPLKNGLHTVFEALALELQGRQSGARPILLVAEEKAVLAVDIDDKQNIWFAVTDAIITGYGLHRLYGTVPQDKQAVYAILQGAAKFFKHLWRSPDKGLLRHKVDVAFHQLEATGELDEDLEDEHVLVGDNLINDGVVDIDADADTKYGVTITNKINVPMFVSLFFFDCSDLSISAFSFTSCSSAC
jgi:hypothetical protein